MRDFSDAKATTRFEGTLPAKINTITDGVSKAGDEMLTVEFKVIGEEFTGFTQKVYFVWDKMPTATNAFAKLLDATGVPRNLQSYSELHGKMCNIEVKYSAKNEQSEIKDYIAYTAPAQEV